MSGHSRYHMQASMDGSYPGGDDIDQEEDDAQSAIVEGDFVSFVSQDGNESFGRVEYVMTDGSFGPEGSKYNVPASSEDPVLLIRLFQDSSIGFVETELLTGSLSSNAVLDKEPTILADAAMSAPSKRARLSAAAIGRALGESLLFDSAEKASYTIPVAVKNNARSGLDLRKKFGRGGTSVGENTARTLAAGGSIGIEKVRHIARYFPRHAGDNLDDKTSNGWIAWQLWGGYAARSWANAIVRSADKKESE